MERALPPKGRAVPRALTALVLAAALSACGSAVDLGGIGRAVGGATPTATSTALTTTDQTKQDAVKLVIQLANEAQARAFNAGDPSVMKGTATDSFYTQLLQTNRALATSGVRSIDIVSTEFRDVVVDGPSATATTLETWRSTYADGSTDEQAARNVYTLVLESGTWRIQTDDQPSAAGQPAPQREVDPGMPAGAASRSSTSTNWSGYSATAGKFTSVTGTWTVPTISATTAGADATWVGIGGIDTRDLIQAGTQAIVETSGGEVAYEAWIEMLPASSKPISLSVNAGDSVTVTLTQRSAVEWSIVLKNNSTGGRFSTTVQYASSNSSAEWVQEAPSVGRGTLPLDDFGILKITGASAVRDGKALDLQALGAEAITMVNGARQALATPSVIASDGASFTVARTSAPSTSNAGTQRRRRG